MVFDTSASASSGVFRTEMVVEGVAQVGEDEEVVDAVVFGGSRAEGLSMLKITSCGERDREGGRGEVGGYEVTKRFRERFGSLCARDAAGRV